VIRRSAKTKNEHYVVSQTGLRKKTRHRIFFFNAGTPLRGTTVTKIDETARGRRHVVEIQEVEFIRTLTS
jgi:hypothetical protein